MVNFGMNCPLKSRRNILNSQAGLIVYKHNITLNLIYLIRGKVHQEHVKQYSFTYILLQVKNECYIL